MAYHPVFGGIAADPFALTPEERAERDLMRRIETEIPDRQQQQIAYFRQLLDFEIDGIGEAPALPAHMHDPVIRRFQTDDNPKTFTPATRTDANGIVWDLQEPGTAIQSGDLDDDEGLWRPRRTAAQCETRYDRAVFLRHAAEKDLAEAIRLHGDDDLRVIAARNKVDAAWAAQAKALKDADDPTTLAREAIDNYRKTDEGKTARNASRRTRATANRDLSGMSEAEEKAHKAEQAKLRKQRQRAALKEARNRAES